MNDDFKILLELLDGDREAGGRSAATISDEVKEKIARFASGESTEQERVEMKKLLQEQPDLIPALVAETKALREPAE